MPPITPPPTHRQAIAYIRASTDDQVNSLEAQRARLDAYCQFKGITLVETFTDGGVSGATPLADRPEGARLLQFLDLSGVTEVIITKVDRAFRDTADCLITVKALNERGIQVHLLDLDVDTSTANGQLFLTMTAALAEWELRRRHERQMDALAVLRRDSRRLGEIPYGWMALTDAGLPLSKRGNASARLIPDPVEQAVLRDIAHWHRAESWGAHRIATELTRRKIPTKKGRPKWAAIVVQGLIDHLDERLAPGDADAAEAA